MDFVFVYLWTATETLNPIQNIMTLQNLLQMAKDYKSAKQKHM